MLTCYPVIGKALGQVKQAKGKQHSESHNCKECRWEGQLESGWKLGVEGRVSPLADRQALPCILCE